MYKYKHMQMKTNNYKLQQNMQIQRYRRTKNNVDIISNEWPWSD